jgi:hypothetical protein
MWKSFDGQPTKDVQIYINMYLSEQDKAFAKAVEEEIERDKAIDELIRYLTGKTVADQGRIQQETPKGFNWLSKFKLGLEYCLSTSTTATSCRHY